MSQVRGVKSRQCEKFTAYASENEGVLNVKNDLGDQWVRLSSDIQVYKNAYIQMQKYVIKSLLVFSQLKLQTYYGHIERNRMMGWLHGCMYTCAFCVSAGLWSAGCFGFGFDVCVKLIWKQKAATLLFVLMQLFNCPSHRLASTGCTWLSVLIRTSQL